HTCIIFYMNGPPPWLMLITNLPGRNPTLRMRIWRALKGVGAAALRDGAYVLPSSKASRQALESQATEIRSAGGAAHVLSFDAESPEQNATFIALFDRTADYQHLHTRLRSFERDLKKLQESAARQRLAG